jgi:hypothetical protein
MTDVETIRLYNTVIRMKVIKRKDEISGQLRILHNKETSIVRIVDSKMLGLAGHVAWMGCFIYLTHGN